MFNNDWIKINYDPCFRLDINPNIQGPLKNHIDCLKENAKEIADSCNGPLEIFFSGGVNSQVILGIYKDLGINFKVYIVEYAEKYNAKDVSEAQRICNNIGIPYTVIDFSLEQFFNTDAERIFKSWQGLDVKHLPLLKFPEFANGNAVLGHSEPYIYRKEIYYSEPSSWSIKFTEENFRITQYLNNSKLCATADWYLKDSKVLMSLLETPIVSMLVDNEFFGKISLVSSRGKIYKKYWPWFDDCAKRTGFENSKEYLLPPYMLEFHNQYIKDKITHGNPVSIDIEEFKAL